jgi:hypothetical protein
MVTDYMSWDLAMRLQSLKPDEGLSKYEVKVALH